MPEDKTDSIDFENDVFAKDLLDAMIKHLQRAYAIPRTVSNLMDVDGNKQAQVNIEEFARDHKNLVATFTKYVEAHKNNKLKQIPIEENELPEGFTEKEYLKKLFQIAKFLSVANTNLQNALNHIIACDLVATEQKQPPFKSNKLLVNTVVLYFFAHSEVEPYAYGELQESHFLELKKCYDDFSVLYEQRREEYKSSKDLLEAYLAQQTNRPLKRIDIIDYPLDKLNNGIWNLPDAGNYAATISMQKSGSKQEIDVFYSINFDALEDEIGIIKRLTPYDKRVYLAVAALYRAGNNVMSLTSIYNAMGYNSKPNKKARERIEESIFKMRKAEISINNSQEAKAYHYDSFIHKGDLLPAEQKNAIIQGKLVEGALWVYREPPLISFARQRKQITTIPLAVIQSPISKTDSLLSIENYLIVRISNAKYGKLSSKILFKTIFENVGIKAKSSRHDAIKAVQELLDHYKACKWITRYTINAEGITVYFHNKQIAK